MKKKILYLLVMGIVFLIPKNVFALSVTTSCSSSSTATLGNTISVTVKGNASDSVMWDLSISYDSSKLQYISGSPTHYVSDNFSSSISLTYNFRTIAIGNAYVKVANAEVATATGDSAISNGGSCGINVVNASPATNTNNNSNKNKNSDNNLKSLNIEGATITPEFNKDTLEYSVELLSDTTKVKINAEKSDSKASVSGVGEVDVKEGLNKLEIIVTAENGSTKTYIINANVLEKEPINVKVGKDDYTLVRKTDNIEPPESYTETTIVINGEEIQAYSNEITGYLLVGLKDKGGNVSWYIYDQNKLTYTKYTELKSNSIRLILLKPKKGDIPYKYYESTFDFSGEMINGYTFDSNSDFRLVYGMNIETGEKLFYVYDIKDKTLQRFYNEQVLIYIDLIKKCKLLFLICGVSIFILFISIILALSKNIKFKKEYLSKVDLKKDDKKEIKYNDIEGTTVIDPILENNMSKKEEKKQIKKKKKNKENKKTFLDE